MDNNEEMKNSLRTAGVVTLCANGATLVLYALSGVWTLAVVVAVAFLGIKNSPKSSPFKLFFAVLLPAAAMFALFAMPVGSFGWFGALVWFASVGYYVAVVRRLAARV